MKRQITKTDETKIKRLALELIKNLQEEYNFFLMENSSERGPRAIKLTTPGSSTRMFLNDRIIIENDFTDRKTAGLPKSEMDIILQDYFGKIAANYGISDNGDDPNQDKHVKLSEITLSGIHAPSPTDSLFIKAFFKISYDGIARKTSFKFEESLRVAQIHLEKTGKNWQGFIETISFYNDSTDVNDKPHLVNIVEEKQIVMLKYEDAIVSPETKTVSRSPSLKKFLINDLWGLLNDEDQSKKVLLQPLFCEINDFEEEELALVCLDGSWGFINKEGIIALECQYDTAEPFKKGRAKVQKGMRIYTIDTKGKEVK